MNANIGNKIRQIRKIRGFTQEIMADRLNISRSAYSRTELGETSVWVYHIKNICKELDVTFEELLFSPESLEQQGGLPTLTVRSYKNKDNLFALNQISEKLINQYEKRVEELTRKIKELEGRKKVWFPFLWRG